MRPSTSEQQQERTRDGLYSFHPEDNLISQVSSSLSTFVWKTLLKGVLAHADGHLYDTCTDKEGERGVWAGCEGRMMLVPLVDGNGGGRRIEEVGD